MGVGMTIDKVQLKALAEAANAVTTDVNITMAVGADPEEVKAVQDYLQVAMPKNILAILAEIERLELDNRSLKGSCAKLGSEHSGMARSLKKANRMQSEARAESEALRKRISDDERKLDALLAHCDDGECVTCGQIICKHGNGMHFHHDGCPSCAQEGEPDSDLGHG